jgi:hypothetical protein
LWIDINPDSGPDPGLNLDTKLGTKKLFKNIFQHKILRGKVTGTVLVFAQNIYRWLFYYFLPSMSQKLPVHFFTK